MTMRKSTIISHIHNVEIEMENHRIFLQAAVDEIEELHQKHDENGLSAKEEKRLLELADIAKGHTKWINAHKAELKAYYSPAMVMAI